MTKYAEYIDENTIKLAPMIIEVNGAIVFHPNETDYRVAGYKPVVEGEKPLGEIKITYKEQKNVIKEIYTVIKTPEEQVREYTDNLELTRADVERAIYISQGIDFDDMLKYVEEQEIPGLDIKRLRIELQANHFVRKHPYISILGTFLGYTNEDLDQLFKTKQLPEKECTLIVNESEI